MLPNLRSNILNRCRLPRACRLPRDLLLILQPHHSHVLPLKAAWGNTRLLANQRSECCQLGKPPSQWETAEPLFNQWQLCPRSARVGSVALAEYSVCRLEVWQSKRNTSRRDETGRDWLRLDTGLNQHISTNRDSRCLCWNYWCKTWNCSTDLKAVTWLLQALEFCFSLFRIRFSSS